MTRASQEGTGGGPTRWKARSSGSHRTARWLWCALLLAGCHRTDPLHRDVRSYCREQADSVAEAISVARRGEHVAVGFGDLETPETGSAAFQVFSFCAQVRAVDGGQKAQARSEFQRAAGRLSAPAIAKAAGRPASAEVTIHALEEMSALYARIDGWPLE